MPYHPMSEAEVRAFLTALPARTAKLATVRADGRPHLAPVWYDLDDDGSLVFNTGESTVKGRNLRREPRVSLCVDDDRPPFSFVVVEGVADISDDLDEYADGRPDSVAGTWVPTAPRSTGVAMAWPENSSCGFGRSALCQPSIWLTEARSLATPRADRGRAQLVALARVPARTPGVRRGRWGLRPPVNCQSGVMATASSMAIRSRSVRAKVCRRRM